MGGKKGSSLKLFILQGLIVVLAQSKMPMDCIRPEAVSTDPVAFSEKKICVLQLSCMKMGITGPSKWGFPYGMPEEPCFVLK